MISPAYHAQVDFLLRILPHVAIHERLALKGGTAINLFVRDMPRFSVDLDLTYLPFDARETALGHISQILDQIKHTLEKSDPDLTATAMPTKEGQDAKLVCRHRGATVKIEVNTIMRGHLWPVRPMQLTESTQKAFNKFAQINVVSHAELFGGKLCAALDRQHPRDLFDVKQLLDRDGLTEDVRFGFIASALSHPRPLHELICPNFLDQQSLYKAQFAGMTVEPFSYADFESTRERLIKEVQIALTDEDRAFLISFKEGDPAWNLFPNSTLQFMPAVRWKLTNIDKLKKQPKKHALQLQALKRALSV
jgi:predicted nucleotidyltransferase component of viral defense system